jgi:hypothetical protein
VKPLVCTFALVVYACVSAPVDPSIPALPQVGRYLLEIPDSASDTLALPRRLMITMVSTGALSYQILRMDGTHVAQGRAPVDDRGHYNLESYAEDLIADVDHFIDHVTYVSLQRSPTSYDCWLKLVTTQFCLFPLCQARLEVPSCSLKYEGP